MAFTRRIFTKEFRLNAAKLVVDEHRPAVDVARELDINPKSLYSWVRQYRSGGMRVRKMDLIDRPC